MECVRIFALIIFSCLAAFATLYALHYHIVWHAPFAGAIPTHFLKKGKAAAGNSLVEVIELKDGINTWDVRQRLASSLKEFYSLGYPLLIKGGLRHWPAYERWQSLEYLLSVVGPNTTVVLQTDVAEQGSKPYVSTSFNAFVKWLTEYPTIKQTMAYKEEIGAAYYMAEEFEFLEDYPQLYKDMLNLTDFRIFKDKLNMVGGDINHSISYGFETAFWMGGAGAKTGWHYDYDYSFNVLCHLKGTKTFYIASPNETENLYPSKKFDPGAILSSINFWSPDYRLYPKYLNVKYEAISLQPGDVMFVPAGFWHAVESKTHSISVSIRLMPRYLWIVNFLDRLWEIFYLSGWYVPKEGTVVHTKTFHADSL